MEAISPLPCWLLRIGGHFILPVLIRMSAGSVTCNLSTKPQQLHRDGKHSHNDIILDWGRVSGGDRWCRFSSPCMCLPPLFSSRRSEMRLVQLSPLHHGPFGRGQGVFFFPSLFTQGQFLTVDCWAFKQLHQDHLSEVWQAEWFLSPSQINI